jgi:hypothetical protein
MYGLPTGCTAKWTTKQIQIFGPSSGLLFMLGRLDVGSADDVSEAHTAFKFDPLFSGRQQFTKCELPLSVPRVTLVTSKRFVNSSHAQWEGETRLFRKAVP